MYGCHHEDGHGYGCGGHRHEPGYGCGRGPGYGPQWASRPTKEEFVQDLEDYKADLEAEIQALEHRLQTLRSKPE